jgi:hypothetical protein
VCLVVIIERGDRFEGEGELVVRTALAFVEDDVQSHLRGIKLRAGPSAGDLKHSLVDETADGVGRSAEHLQGLRTQ